MWPRRARYCSRRRETSTRHSGSPGSSLAAALTAAGARTSLRSSGGALQNEQFSLSSSRRAPHFEQMRITGPFCAAEVPVKPGNHSTPAVRSAARASLRMSPISHGVRGSVDAAAPVPAAIAMGWGAPRKASNLSGVQQADPRRARSRRISGRDLRLSIVARRIPATTGSAGITRR